MILHFFFRWRIFPLDLFVEIWRYGKSINGWWFRRISVEVFAIQVFSFSDPFRQLSACTFSEGSRFCASIVIASDFGSMVVLPHHSFPFTHTQKAQMWRQKPFVHKHRCPEWKTKAFDGNMGNALPQPTLTNTGTGMSMASIEMKSSCISHSGLGPVKNASNGETMFAFVFDKYQHITRIHRTCI